MRHVFALLLLAVLNLSAPPLAHAEDTATPAPAATPAPSPAPKAAPSALAMPIPKAPEVAARGYLLEDFHSGQVLAENNADTRLEPASITKIMASYVIFKELAAGKIKLDDRVTISEKAWRMEGSRMFVEVGKQIPVQDLLIGMIVQSGNDATVALAEHVAGTEEAFAGYMNQYAKELGMTGSHFADASGMPHPEHFMTARDIAIMARALITEFPDYYKWYSMKEYTFNGIVQHNRNRLLYSDTSVDGIKTGHTEAAGFCLVSSAQRNGMRLIAVVLGADSDSARASASQSLLNYGFSFFETHKLYDGNSKLVDARVWKGAQETVPLGLKSPLFITIPRGQYDQLKANVQLPGQIIAPVAADAKLGSVQVKLGDKLLLEPALSALQAVEEGSIWRRAVDEVKLYFE